MGNDTRLSNPENARELINELQELIRAARHLAARSVNTVQVLTNFEIGRRIVEYEQQGKRRAEYGQQILKVLSMELTAEFGKGFSETNLKLMRQFYLLYRGQISQTMSDQLLSNPKSQALSDQLSKSDALPWKFSLFSQKAPFVLSWSHYVFLLNIKDVNERSFYEIEVAKTDGMGRGAGGWKMSKLAAKPCEQLAKADKLDATIRKNLEVLGSKGKSLLNEMAVMFNSADMN